MADVLLAEPAIRERKSARDIGFASGIIAILSIFFLPIPAFLIDIGLAFSIAFSVLPVADVVDEHEPLPAITNFNMFASTALLFISNLHWEILRGIAASYAALPVSSLFDPRRDLAQVSDCLEPISKLRLRVDGL